MLDKFKLKKSEIKDDYLICEFSYKQNKEEKLKKFVDNIQE